MNNYTYNRVEGPETTHFRTTKKGTTKVQVPTFFDHFTDNSRYPPSKIRLLGIERGSGRPPKK